MSQAHARRQPGAAAAAMGSGRLIGLLCLHALPGSTPEHNPRPFRRDGGLSGPPARSLSRQPRPAASSAVHCSRTVPTKMCSTAQPQRRQRAAAAVSPAGGDGPQPARVGRRPGPAAAAGRLGQHGGGGGQRRRPGLVSGRGAMPEGCRRRRRCSGVARLPPPPSPCNHAYRPAIPHQTRRPRATRSL